MLALHVYKIQYFLQWMLHHYTCTCFLKCFLGKVANDRQIYINISITIHIRLTHGGDQYGQKNLSLVHTSGGGPYDSRYIFSIRLCSFSFFSYIAGSGLAVKQKECQIQVKYICVKLLINV